MIIIRTSRSVLEDIFILATEMGRMLHLHQQNKMLLLEVWRAIIILPAAAAVLIVLVV